MTENQVFEQTRFESLSSLDTEYNNCTFRSCDFSHAVIRQTTFDTCRFESCDFSLTKFCHMLRNVVFTDCRITGAEFTELNKCSNELVFEKSMLNYANFVGVKMHKTVFRDCLLHEAYFDDSDLTSSCFDLCDLERASFHRTNLEKVDFSSSFHFTINPTQCKLKKTIFPENELRGLVAHLNIIIK